MVQFFGKRLHREDVVFLKQAKHKRFGHASLLASFLLTTKQGKFPKDNGVKKNHETKKFLVGDFVESALYASDCQHPVQPR